MLRFRIALPVLIVGILMGSWSIGEDKDPPAKAKGTLPANWKKLGLAEDQVQMVYRVQTRYRTQIDDLKAKIKDLEKEEKAEMIKVLTPAQKDRLKEIVSGEIKPPDKDKPSDKDKPKDKDK